MQSWLAPSTPADVRAVILAALRDVGEHEIPYGSNRGTWIDEIVKRAGSPVGSPWCACAVRSWWVSVGWDVPAQAGASDHWRMWAITEGRWNEDSPTPGAVILYSRDGIFAHHAELVIGCDDAIPVMTVGGNTSIEGFPVTGEIVTIKDPAAHPGMKILGYVWPP
jgi:hypothetical protein